MWVVLEGFGFIVANNVKSFYSKVNQGDWLPLVAVWWQYDKPAKNTHRLGQTET